MEKLGCDFLLNKDDDIEEYERQNLKKTECEQEPDIIESMTKTLGRDAAIGVLQGLLVLSHQAIPYFERVLRNFNLLISVVVTARKFLFKSCVKSMKT